ncbi:MAG: FG-GAP-like repeat-containing protein [Deltaproteobacteria bacterium]|nr:FG-GAP-like repeat-containing protein [Deltaproteobacteria bacterium]
MRRNVVGFVVVAMWAITGGCTDSSRQCNSRNLTYVESEGRCIGFCGPDNTTVLCVSADGGVVEAGLAEAGVDAGMDVSDARSDATDADAAETLEDALVCDEAQARCSGMCVNTQTDPRHCGSCGRSCPVALGGTELCTAGECSLRCNPGRHLCAMQCAEDTSPTSCGTLCIPCPAPPLGGIATCESATCGFVCAPGYDRVGAGCELRIPRQIAPLSTSTVTSQRPTLRWAQPMGVSETQLELCRDRTMTIGCQMQRVMGNSVRPTVALTAGLWYWRVRGVQAGTPGSMSSPVWQFRVGFRSAPADTSWGTEADFNGDGYADLAVGAPAATAAGRSNAGTVSVYMGSAAGLASTPSVVLLGGAIGDNFGRSVASAGDVNGDGYADLVVGADGASPGGRYQAGTVSVFAGSAMGIRATVVSLIEGADATTNLGGSVASAGDVNGDGYADIVVGVPRSSGGGGSGGTASVFIGGAAGINTTPAAALGGVVLGDNFGSAVAGLGDVNGDGYADVGVGADSASPGGRMNAGTVSVFTGSSAGISATPAIVIQGLVAGDNLGQSVSCAGDVNGDGYADLIAGAPNASPSGRYRAGTASVFVGSATGTSPTAAITLQGVAVGDNFGRSVAGLGDTDRDGYADLVVGLPIASPGGLSAAGSVSVFAGSAMGITATPALVLNGTAATDSFGRAVASPGDVNGDGYADLVVGADGASPGGRMRAGTASVFAGSMMGVRATPQLVLEGVTAGDLFGQSLAR